MSNLSTAYSHRFWREMLVIFSASDTQTLENVARKIAPKFHAKFHDTFWQRKTQGRANHEVQTVN